MAPVVASQFQCDRPGLVAGRGEEEPDQGQVEGEGEGQDFVGVEFSAAVAFVGTTTHGDSQDPTFGMDSTGTRYLGAEYHVYIATTYDRGRAHAVP